MDIRQHHQTYVVDDDDRLYFIPESRFRRIRRGVEPVYLYAGQALRFARTVVGYDDRGQRLYTLALFPVLYFRDGGHLSEAHQEYERKLTRTLFALDDKHPELAAVYQAERQAFFAWQPSDAILKELALRSDQFGVDDAAGAL